jgi:hypothetical protein
MAIQRSLGLAALLVACSPAPAPQRPVDTRAQQFGALDSARIDSLCADPDSVRAGRKACVLRDQSPPIRPMPRVPPAPPPEHR